MNVKLMFSGVLLLVFGYLIGVKGMIGLVTFLRNRRVSDEKKVASILGGSQVGMGAILVTLGALGFQQDALVVMPNASSVISCFGVCVLEVCGVTVG